MFKRGLKNQFIQQARPLDPSLPNRVGSAFTLRYISAREDLNSLAVFQERQHPQRQAVAQCPPGAVLVMDSPKIARLAIPTHHQRPGAPTNLTLHQALDINQPIGCGDVAVWPGDGVVGDGEGVVVIPAVIADEVAAEAVEMTALEDFVTKRVLAGQSILGLYPPIDEQSRVDLAAWRLAAGGWPWAAEARSPRLFGRCVGPRAPIQLRLAPQFCDWRARVSGAAHGLMPCGLTTSGALRASHRPAAPAGAGWRPS